MTTKSLLRVATAGSVDDGKSTLIGRLLYESKSLAIDQLAAIEAASARRGFSQGGALDLSLLTDGLIAEREQGITIDVAYRYFATGKRQFILADSPGHEQYTRNMVTAASTADVAIVLVDASKGVLTQTRRHAAITALLHVPHLIVAVNKMDRVSFDEAVFRRITGELQTFFAQHPHLDVQYLPVAALLGDNIVTRSPNTPWYRGPALLPLLESIAPRRAARSDTGDGLSESNGGFRFAVQRIVRPDAANPRRGYQGLVTGAAVAVGDTVCVLPGKLSARVARILTWDGVNRCEHLHTVAEAGTAVTLELDAQLDISRGDVIASTTTPASVGREFRGTLCWMDETPANPAHGYLMKLGTRVTPVEIHAVEGLLDLANGALVQADTAPVQASPLSLNALARVRIKARQAVAFDAYADNHATGAFVLIDEVSNRTVAAGTVA